MSETPPRWAEPDAVLRSAHDAEALLSRLQPYLHARREAVIQSLITHHRADDLSEGMMRSGIAALSELAAIHSDLVRLIRHGEKEVTHGPIPYPSSTP